MVTPLVNNISTRFSAGGASSQVDVHAAILFNIMQKAYMTVYWQLFVAKFLAFFIMGLKREKQSS